MKRVLLLACVLVALVAPATAAAGSFTEHRLGGYDYWVYEPTGFTPGTQVPVLVYLHGTGEQVPDAAVGTRWNEQAEKDGFLVVYPQQPSSVNLGAWRWVYPEHQRRDAGEPKAIADIARHVIDTRGADRSRVFVAGASAGGAMATVMGATYPDVFAAVGNLAGCGYATCTDVTGRSAYTAMGSHARPVPLFAAAGTLDPTYMGMSTGVQQWLGTSDLADDGAANGSVPRTAARTGLWPTKANEYPVAVQTYNDRDGRELILFATAVGATHQYLGGNPAGGPIYTSMGPPITPNLWAFLMRHPMP